MLFLTQLSWAAQWLLVTNGGTLGQPCEHCSLALLAQVTELL
jgi:hypothetical protein